MSAILSLVDGWALAYLIRGSEVKEERLGSSPADILQFRAGRIEAGRIFKPHAHLPARRSTIGTSEAWVVAKGSVKVSLYDIDDALIAEVVLLAGDCLVTVRGGHSMEVVEDTLIYEFKNGPYMGQEVDKRWL